MIGYTTIGANDYDRARSFYDAVLEPLGGKRAFEFGDRIQFYGAGKGPMLAVCKPYDGGGASFGNGTMVALAAPSREAVDQALATALANGGVCEGPPGLRNDNFYGAYFRDPEGNKLCAFKMG